MQTVSHDEKLLVPTVFLTASWRKGVSSVLVAVAIFLSINFFVTRVHDSKKQAEAANTLLQLEIERVKGIRNTLTEMAQPPKLVLVGSSVIGHPFSSLDGSDSYFKRKYDVDAFRDDLGDNFVAVNMGTDGAMISDSCLSIIKCLPSAKSPQFLVLGITPRDFGDHRDSSYPCYSYQFKTLTQLTDFFDVQAMYLPKVEDKCDFVLKHLLSLYCYRFTIQSRVADVFQNLTGHSSQSQAVATDELEAMKKAEASGEHWSKTLDEYKLRYAGLDDRDVLCQMPFLQRLIQTCNSRKIKLLVVNMPLSSDNRQLLPVGFYDSFRRRLALNLAKDGGTSSKVQFLDLGDSPEFSRDSFVDCAHLNQFGARKLLKHIVAFVRGAS